jgi:hypothetical protein
MTGDIVKRDEPALTHERAIELEIALDTGVAMVAVDKQEIERGPAK